MSKAQKGSGGFPAHEDQGLRFGSTWEQKPGFWSSEDMRTRGRAAGTLTFADDPVQDGLQLLNADLHVLGGEGRWHLPWGKAVPWCPLAPRSSTPSLPPRPAA